MAWPGGDQGYGGGHGPQSPGGWYGPPPPGGPGGYGGGPGFFPPPPPPSSRSGGVIVAIVLGAVILLGGVAAAAFVLVGTHDEHPAAQPLASGSPGGPVGPSAPALSAPSPTPTPTARAKVPGWQAVVSVKHGLTYDVPPTWTVQSPGTIVGFEDAKGRPEVAGSGAAIYKEGYCPGHSGSWRAEAAVTGYSTVGLAADAADAAKKWGTYGYTPDHGGSAPAVTLSAASPVNAGGIASEEVTATVTVHDPGDACSPPHAIVHAVATPLKNGNVSVLVVIADQGVPGAAKDTDLEKIAHSVRRSAG